MYAVITFCEAIPGENYIVNQFSEGQGEQGKVYAGQAYTEEPDHQGSGCGHRQGRTHGYNEFNISHLPER